MFVEFRKCHQLANIFKHAFITFLYLHHLKNKPTRMINYSAWPSNYVVNMPALISKPLGKLEVEILNSYEYLFETPQFCTSSIHSAKYCQIFERTIKKKLSHNWNYALKAYQSQSKYKTKRGSLQTWKKQTPWTPWSTTFF